MQFIKVIFKIIAIPFISILTIGTPVFVFLFCYAAVFMEIASGIGVLLSIALLLTGEKLGCCVFLFLSFLLSPFGIPAIGEWLADRLRSINFAPLFYRKLNTGRLRAKLARSYFYRKGGPHMATTYFKTHHISKGETIVKSMKDRFDYGQNPEKTQGGDLVLAYECDPKTADREFLLSKAKYKVITGREQKKDEDILCYQVRQSFVPGEVDSKTALQIGYDFAMRWTKGKHAFFVVSHVDRPHPHVHIYYNSTTLDCTRKFRDFLGSARAVRRLSDRICLENDLSYINNPDLKSKGKFKHYGEWQSGNRPPTFQERLKAQIDVCLAEKPPDMDSFIQAMAVAGFEAKYGRGGVLSFRNPAFGQDRFTRLRASTLGKGHGGYTGDD